MMNKKGICFFAFLFLLTTSLMAEDSTKVIPAGSKVFINPMPDGFETYIADALKDKKVPLEIVTEKEKAEFEIAGTSQTQKAGAAKVKVSYVAIGKPAK